MHPPIGERMMLWLSAGRSRILEGECTDFGWIAHGFRTAGTSRILEVAGLLRGSVEGCCGGWLCGHSTN